MDNQSEKKLVQNAQRNPEAFGVLFDTYYKQIYAYTLRRIGNVAVAEDIVSETFFRALRGLWKFRWQNKPFSAWLYRIAINEMNRYFRDKSTHFISLEKLIDEHDYEFPDPHSHAKEVEAAEQFLQAQKQIAHIRASIDAMPARYQEVLSLRFFADKSIAEIAAILNKKEGTVKSLISRGLEKIRLQFTIENSVYEK